MTKAADALCLYYAANSSAPVNSQQTISNIATPPASELLLVA